MSDWTDCSVLCGTGTQTRSIDCTLSGPEGTQKVSISESKECTSECHSTKLMVLGGSHDPRKYRDNPADIQADVIDFSQSVPSLQCLKVSDIPEANLRNAVGGVIEDTPIICSGYIENTDTYEKTGLPTCLTLNNNGTWAFSVPLNKPRSFASAVTINESLWITGGSSIEDAKILTDTELVTLTKSQNFVHLPEPMSSHCLIKINETHVLATGGENLNRSTEEVTVNTLSSTFLFDFNTHEWSSGPTLLQPRSGHACGSFDFGDSTLLVVAGGKEFNNTAKDNLALQSVEVLDTKEWSKGWQPAQNLPIELYYGSIVPLPNNKGLIFVGGEQSWRTGWLNINLLEFKCYGQTLDSCLWTANPSRNLAEASHGHVALWIPERIQTTMFEC